MKIVNEEKGFTLVEMLIVMMIISILLIVVIPNVTKYQKTIRLKGCNAFVKNVQSQVQGYMLENDGKIPTLGDLQKDNYVTNNLSGWENDSYR